MLQYRFLRENEIDRALFKDFIRRQVVTNCWRKENGTWVVKEVPFIDDWTEADYAELVKDLRNTAVTGGLVYAAFSEDRLKGFVSVESGLFGGEHKYLDLSSIHVSEDMRGQGIGAALVAAAKRWAKEHGAKKLYISAHSSKESQCAYRSLGCVEAEEINPVIAENEPFDIQMEYQL